MNQTCPAESRTVNPGITPSFLAEITVQPPGAGPVPDPGPFDEFVDRDGYGPQPVREPRRVRHFIDRVEVLRADVRRLVARPGEQVLEGVVLQIDFPLLHVRRVLCVDDPRDRIVGIELLAVRARPSRHRDGDDTRQRDQPLTSPACVAHHQNAPPALTRRRAACSRLCATSTLNA